MAHNHLPQEVRFLHSQPNMCSPRVQPDRVCCLNIVSIRILGNDLTRCWSVTVNHKMGGSNPLLPAKHGCFTLAAKRTGCNPAQRYIVGSSPTTTTNLWAALHVMLAVDDYSLHAERSQRSTSFIVLAIVSFWTGCWTISRKRYGSVLCLERSGGGSTPPRVTNYGL